MPQDPQEYQIPKYESETTNPELLASSESLAVASVFENEVIPTSYYEKKVANAFAAEQNLTNLDQMISYRLSIQDARKKMIEKTLFIRQAKKNWAKSAVNRLIGGTVSTASAFGAPQDLTEQTLMQHESLIGSEILGPVANGGQQTFFLNTDGDWYWHAVSADEKSQLTTRYKVDSDGVLKIQDGVAYKRIEGEEVANLVRTTQLYHTEVTRRIYQSDYDLAA